MRVQRKIPNSPKKFTHTHNDKTEKKKKKKNAETQKKIPNQKKAKLTHTHTIGGRPNEYEYGIGAERKRVD